jgi:hypothetical protein
MSQPRSANPQTRLSVNPQSGSCCFPQPCSPAAPPTSRRRSATTPSVPPLPAVPAAVTDDRPKPLHVPPAWTPSHAAATAAGTPTGRVENANAAARVQPRREGYYNAIQIYPWSEGALYQVYAAPGRSPTSRWSPAKA